MELLHTDTLAEAREKLRRETENFILRTKKVESRDALGCICARDIFAEENIPSFRRSIVDGYAVIARDSYGAGESMPAFYEVTGKVNIEEPAVQKVRTGEAVFLQTGSMVPEGANAVRMIEYTQNYAPGKRAGYRPVSEGENIIQIGEDVGMGECLISRGEKISPEVIGKFAALGIREVEVFEPLKVTVISTGDELADMDEPLSGSKIRDINSYALGAQARSFGMEILHQIRQKDCEEDIEKTLRDVVDESDVILMSGGSSKGSKDYTKKVLEAVTGNVFTHGISIKPGKPTILAYDRAKNTVIAGLPGHPMAAVMMFRLIIGDWYFSKAGIRPPLPHFAVMGENVSSNQGRETCLLVRLLRGENDYTAIPIYAKSGSISALGKADGYVMIPRNKEGLKKGERVLTEEFV